MYSREKHFRQEETPKSKKSHRNTPSFSSSLLDEICRSIDDKLPDPKTPNSAALSLSKVEKWMESDKSAPRRRPKSDNAVFPDTDPSTSHRPKPVRTSREKDSYLFDDYEAHERRHRAAAGDNNNQQNLIKSKSRAMRIYSNLRRMKQPVSPGARLTTFFASIFSGLGRKKAPPKSPPEKAPAACSTKCSSKISHHETEIERRSSQQSQLDLARALVDRDTEVPRVNRSLGGGGGRPPLPPSAFRKNEKNRDLNKSRYKIYDEEDEEEEDAISESSSDLFELDHSSLFAIRDRLCEELPVYETTYFDKNRRLFR